MRYVFDNNFSHKIPADLSLTGDDVVHLKAICNVSAIDVEWLKLVGDMECIVFTLDGRIRTRPLERLALKESGITAVFVAKGFFALGG